MIDRLEMFTSMPVTSHFLDSIDKVPEFRSKLIEEDDDIKEIKKNDLNYLYKNVYTFKTIARKTGEYLDDPVSFFVFAFPRFHRRERDGFKIVCNPSRHTWIEIRQFLERNFATTKRTNWQSRFRLGRVDFAVDLRDYSVEDLYRMIYFDRKSRKHIATRKLEEDKKDEKDLSIRTIASSRLETFYVGRNPLLRVYDKKLEARYQISVCKREGRAISKKLCDTSNELMLTRIEMQIRDLGNSGMVRKPDKTKIWNPTRGYHRLRTLKDLSECRRKDFDIFSDVKFKDLSKVLEFDREAWKGRAFQALINDVGFDQAMKILPADRRREFRDRIKRQKFLHDLDQILYDEVSSFFCNVT